jgi:predicted aspartyl protease
MATFSVTIEVGSPDRTVWEPVEVLADTGATFTWLPRPLLERLGYEPESTKSFEMGDGRIVDSEVGEVSVRIGSEVRNTVCVFANEDARSALGAVTMEQFLLAPDQVNRRLVPVVGLRMTRP